MQPDNHVLIGIDLQNDFCPGGLLAVAGGDEIIAGINALMDDFATVVLTQDWHPAGHSSFASSHSGAEPFSTMQMPYGPQTLWPDHCIQGTEGAALRADLRSDPAALIIRKGMNPALDSYSAFFENDHVTQTGLDGFLRTRGIEAITLAGLATDYCVAWSALDAARLGYRVTVRTDLSRAIDLDGSLAQAIARLREAGVTVA